MDKQYDQLIDDILDNYHEKIYETVPFSDLGDFLTDLLMKYKERHPYKQPSVTEIDGVQIFDWGDYDPFSKHG